MAQQLTQVRFAAPMLGSSQPPITPAKGIWCLWLQWTHAFKYTYRIHTYIHNSKYNNNNKPLKDSVLPSQLIPFRSLDPFVEQSFIIIGRDYITEGFVFSSFLGGRGGQNLTLAQLAWNSQSSPGWPQTHTIKPQPYVLGLQVWATIPGFIRFWHNRTIRKAHATE